DPWFAKVEMAFDTVDDTLSIIRTVRNHPGEINESLTTQTIMCTKVSTGEWRLRFMDPISGGGHHHEILQEQLSQQGDPIRIVRERSRYSDDTDPNDDPVVDRAYQKFRWGERLICEVLDPLGAGLTTTWQYYLS